MTAFVSIQQGCNMDCTFCIVPKTRGDERSRPDGRDRGRVPRPGRRRACGRSRCSGRSSPATAAREIAPAGAARSPFVRLLERIHEIEGIARIRFTSPHPRGFRQDLVEAYGRLPKLCEYVHLPLQSGSDRILRAMNRPYTRARYLEIVAALRAVRPGHGLLDRHHRRLPGRDGGGFRGHRAAFEAVDYDMAYIFKYSIRTGTPAAALPGQVPEEVKEQRNQVLLRVLEANSLRRNQALRRHDPGGAGRGARPQGPAVPGPHARQPHGALRRRRGAGRHAWSPVRIVRATTSALYGEVAGGRIEG